MSEKILLQIYYQKHDNRLCSMNECLYNSACFMNEVRICTAHVAMLCCWQCMQI